MREGKGCFQAADGSLYKGMWRNNLQHGIARIDKNGTNGDYELSTWVDGRRQGLAKLVYTTPHSQEVVIY